MANKAIRKFFKQQDGALTAFGLFLGLSSIVIGGLAIDVASAMMARTQLQAAADAAAHAALYIRDSEDSATAKTAALAIAETNMPAARFGSLLTADDIQFGYWDRDANAFQIDPDSKDAVFVDISRLAAKGNSVGTYFLRFAGFNSWDVRRGAVFETYIPKCFREGFVADGIIDIQTDNIYRSGFCLHSNTHMELNSNNTFEDGTIVSMPDKQDVVLSSSGMETNDGLAAALRDNSYQMRLLSRVDDIIAGVLDSSSDYYQSYITSSIPIVLSRNDKLDASKFTSGRIHTIACNSDSQQATIHELTTLTEVVIWTNCKMKFGANVTLKNVVIVNENTRDSSFNSASGLQLGKDDNCATGGGVQLVTRGGIKFPQYLSMFGGQMIALGDISFSADANGIEGASVIAGGRIDGTTNMDMGFCGGAGMENNFEAVYFRLAS